IGTPLYMSPEQARGGGDDVGPSTDVWAMGAILQEMSTGEPAFTGASAPEILSRIIRGHPDPIWEKRPEAPRAFVDVVKAALSRGSDRILSAYELRERLRCAFEAESTSKRGAPFGLARRLAWSAALGGVGLMVWLGLRPPARHALIRTEALSLSPR